MSSAQMAQNADVLSCFKEGAFDIAYRLDSAIWVFDIDRGRVVHANDAACRLWDAEDEAALKERPFGEDMSAGVAKRLRQYQADFIQSDQKFTELWTLYPNGKPSSVMVMFRGYKLPDGRMAMLCEAVGHTETQPENVRSAEALLHTDVMISLFSRSGPSLYLNPAARNAFGGRKDNFRDLFVNEWDCDHILSQVDQQGEIRLVTRIHTVLGSKWFDITAKSCLDAATGHPALLFTCIDVTELKEARDKARHLADRDQLTGLHNRSYLQTHLAWLEDRHVTDGCAILFFDVDRFKLINDRYGHEAGDAVLRNIALRTKAVLRPDDMVARLGGDEFVAVIEGSTDDETLNSLVERLRSAVAKPLFHEQTRFDVTISVGIAKFQETTQSFSEVLRQADIALYISKQRGRDRATFFCKDMGDEVSAREQLELELKRAVEQQEFCLFFQPRLDLRSRRIVGAEGLVRWLHPTRGILPPGVFISVCEETGLIDDLGRIVLEQGCKQAIEWNAAGLDLTVSLNVSPRQFSDPKFMDTLKDLSNQPGFPKGRVELEITENVLIGDHKLLAEKLQLIRAMGYHIAIDDFGTGYSNLAYIARFPLTCLKIDRSFINQLPESGPLVQLILSLGDQIGATIVSEGVETNEQLEWLERNGCEEVQGYLITPPLPVEQFEECLAAFPLSELSIAK